MVYSLPRWTKKPGYKKCKRKEQNKEQVISVVPTNGDDELTEEFIPDGCLEAFETIEGSPKSQDKELPKTEIEQTPESTYRTIKEDDFLFDILQRKDRVIVHFFHNHFTQCKLIDKHLTHVSSLYNDMKKIFSNETGCHFFRVDTQDTPFLIIKHKIYAYPTVAAVENGEILSRFCFDSDRPGGWDVRKFQDWLIEMGFRTELSFDGSLASSETMSKHRRQSHYMTINEDEFIQKCSSNTEPAFVHFFLNKYDDCELVDKQLRAVASKQKQFNYYRVDALSAAMLVIKHKILAYPTVLAIENGEIVSRFSFNMKEPRGWFKRRLCDWLRGRGVEILDDASEQSRRSTRTVQPSTSLHELFSSTPSNSNSLHSKSIPELKSDASVHSMPQLFSSIHLKSMLPHRSELPSVEDLLFLSPRTPNKDKRLDLSKLLKKENTSIKMEKAKDVKKQNKTEETKLPRVSSDSHLDTTTMSAQTPVMDQYSRRHSDSNLTFEEFDFWGDFDEIFSHEEQNRNKKRHENEPLEPWGEALVPWGESITVEKSRRRNSDSNLVCDSFGFFEDFDEIQSFGDQSDKTKKKRNKNALDPRGKGKSNKKKSDKKAKEKKNDKSKRSSTTSMDKKKKDVQKTKKKQKQTKIRHSQSDTNLASMDISDMEMDVQKIKKKQKQPKMRHSQSDTNLASMDISDMEMDVQKTKKKQKQPKIRHSQSDTNLASMDISNMEMVDLSIIEKALNSTSFHGIHAKEFTKEFMKDSFYGMTMKDVAQRKDQDLSRRKSETDIFFNIISEYESPLRASRRLSDVSSFHKSDIEIPFEIECVNEDEDDDVTVLTMSSISRKEETDTSSKKLNSSCGSGKKVSSEKNTSKRKQERRGSDTLLYVAKNSDGTVRKKPSYKTTMATNSGKRLSMEVKETKNARLTSVETNQDWFFGNIDIPSSYPNLACRSASNTSN